MSLDGHRYLPGWRELPSECKLNPRSRVQELDQIDVALSESPALGMRSPPRETPAPGRSLCCEVITDFPRLESLSLEWQRLWESDCRAEIFQTPGWGKAWWRSYGQQYTLCSVVVYEEDELIGLVPLVKRANVVQFLGTPQADYADIICEESRVTEVLAAALRTLLNWSEGWSECVLQHLAKYSRIVRYHQDLPRELRRRLHLVPTESYQTIVLRDNREEVFKEVMGKQHTRRRQNKLRKAGRLRFRHLETKVEAQEYLNDFFRHHVRRRAAIGKKSSCASPEFCNFLRALVDEIEPDRLRFGVLELDSSALAWALGFRVNGKFLLYQHTFDVDAWDYSPGEVLLVKLLEYARNNITREFDFGKGREAYKNRFANHTRETFSLFIERPGLVGEMHGLLRETQGAVHLAVDKLERAVTAYRPALRLLRSFHTLTTGALSSARQPRKNRARLKYFWDLTSQLFNQTFTGKPRFDVFVSNRDAEPNTEHLVSAPSNPEVSITIGRLGDLVDVALECPNMLALSQIQQCRQRLKRGDRVYIVRENSHATLLSWIVTNMPTNSRDGALRPAAGDRPAILMNECTSESRLDSATSYRHLLSLLRIEAARNKSELIVRCRADQSMLRGELQRQGFLPTSESVKGAGRSR
jgi:CelD/BcsL family acetyltransferase involved in cellulose biosynthesis